MNLFEIVPENFFSPLSSKNKEIYVDALMLLHKLFQYELNIETSDFLASLIDLLENRVYEIEDDDEASEGGLTLSAKARLILNRFVVAGWVDRENMDGSFTEVITPRNYAIQVMRLLYDLSDTRLREYNSLVFSTYSSLKEARFNQPNQMYEAIINAKSNTEKLTYELKTLYHGIRSYLRKLQGQHDVNSLLRDHFDEYKALADRIYHPIKTMDSVYRYMAPIREILADVLGDAAMLDNTRRRAMAVRGYESEDAAGYEILTAIDYVIDVYQSIGGIVNEIDKKHSTYTKLSVDTIRYHMTADQTVGGKLAALLKDYAASSGVRREKILGLMERETRVNRQEFFDGRSLWHKTVKSRRASAEPLSVDSGEGLSEAEANDIIKSLKSDYSLQQIKGYMSKLFGDKSSISSDDIDIRDDSEFILFLLAAIRAGEKSINFKAQIGTGAKTTNGYVIPQIIFHKKGGEGKYVD
ncbi:MAG: DUF5716 family protein [Peptococcaceae bacterium]|jgi:hypothetical protein|nr:DUF5716 family protein [Peptococcaceae bacterium]